MTTAQVVETSVTVNNSPIQDYVHPDDQTQPTFEVSLSLLLGSTPQLIKRRPYTGRVFWIKFVNVFIGKIFQDSNFKQICTKRKQVMGIKTTESACVNTKIGMVSQ